MRNVDKDKMKGGNRIIVKHLVGVYGPKIVDKQINDLIKLGPEFYPSWSDIGFIERKIRFDKLKYLIRMSNNKLMRNFISIWKSNINEKAK